MYIKTLDNLAFQREIVASTILTIVEDEQTIVLKDLQRSFTTRIVSATKAREVFFDSVVLDQGREELSLGNRTTMLEASNELTLGASVVVEVTTVIFELGFNKLGHLCVPFSSLYISL